MRGAACICINMRMLENSFMNKADILEMIRLECRSALKHMQDANSAAVEGATDSESRAETKWDTSGLEASYLARGYARQFEALANQYEQLKSIELKDFKNKPIGLGALIQCEIEDVASWFFLLPYGGGMELRIAGEELTVITPDSPLARELFNRKSGTTYTLPNGRPGKILQVL